MKKRSMIALLLTIGVLFLSCPTALAAGEQGTFLVSDAAGKAGETVTVTVSVKDNPGMIATALRISYDAEKLELIEAHDKKLMSGTTTFSQNYMANPYYVSWNDALATEDTTADGDLVTLTFRVRENCPDGVYDIGLSFKPGDVFNKELENQPFTAEAGKITVGTPETDDTGSSSEPDDTDITAKPDDSDREKPKDNVEQKPAELPAEIVKPAPAMPAYSAYRDLAETGWYRAYVEFMLQKGYMNGIAADRFDPSGNVSRAQLVTILYRAAGEPFVTGNVGFTDVKSGSWYDKAVAWCSVSGIVTGVGDNRFAPGQDITREQLAVMLYRSSGSPVVSQENLQGFSDAGAISSYAVAAVNWAVAKGILTGDGGRLLPGETATRVQAAAMMTRYLQQAETVPVPQLPGAIR